MGVLLAGPTLLTLDTMIALLRGWKTASQLDWAIVGLQLVVATALWGSQFVPRIRAWMIQHAPRLAALSISLILTWFTAEIPVGWYTRQSTAREFHTRGVSLDYTFRPAPGVMPGIHGTSRFTTQANGIRGPKLPADSAAYRILCIGGSTTECVYLDDAEAWPNLLRKELQQVSQRPIWVGNVGVSGYSCGHHLRFVRESPLMSNVDCLVLMVGFNDLARFLRTGTTHLSSESTDTNQFHAPLWRSSGILYLARQAHRQIRQDQIQVDDFAGRNYIARRQRRQNSPVTEQPPSLDVALGEYREHLASITASCRDRGVLPVFVTQPVLWDEGLSPHAESLLWLGDLSDGLFLSAEAGRKAIDQFNRTLKSFAAAQQVACIDLSELHGVEAYFYDDCHFSELGAETVAHHVAEWFLHDSSHAHLFRAREVAHARVISRQDEAVSRN